MPQARFDRLDPERQEAILAAAAEEFAERGYESASVNRIARRAGTSKGALYYYFEDKADLFGTVLERAMARVLSEVEWPPPESFTAANFWDVVRSGMRRSLEAMGWDTWYMRVMWSFHRLREEPAAQVATGRVLEQGRELTRSFFQRGQELGVVRTDLPLDLLVEMYVAADMAGDKWLTEHWAGFTEREQRELMEVRVDLVQDMMSARQRGGEQ